MFFCVQTGPTPHHAQPSRAIHCADRACAARPASPRGNPPKKKSGVHLGIKIRPPAGWGGGGSFFYILFSGVRKWLKPTKINSPEKKEKVRRPPTGWGGEPPPQDQRAAPLWTSVLASPRVVFLGYSLSCCVTPAGARSRCPPDPKMRKFSLKETANIDFRVRRR